MGLRRANEGEIKMMHFLDSLKFFLGGNDVLFCDEYRVRFDNYYQVYEKSNQYDLDIPLPGTRYAKQSGTTSMSNAFMFRS